MKKSIQTNTENGVKQLIEMINSCFTYGGADKESHNFERYILPYKNIVIAERGKANTDISPVWNDVELAKKIGKRTCYDYSGLTLTVWYKGEPKSWNDYNNRKKLKP